MLIGISGKIGSGKDTIGKIIQYLTSESSNKMSSKYRPFSVFLLRGGGNQLRNFDHHYYSDVEIKKFADKLKDIVCLLIGCTREQLEDHEFKNTELGEEWKVYTINSYKAKSNTNLKGILTGPYSTEEEAKKVLIKHFGEECHIETYILTPRLLLQLLGTEAGRNIIHPNIWVNALFSQYKEVIYRTYVPTRAAGFIDTYSYPNWCITDMRFPNELEAVKSRKGISIRINRTLSTDNPKELSERLATALTSEHESEKALDNAEFDYTIENNGSMEDLVNKVREILIKEQIIK